MPFISRSPLSYVATATDVIAHWTQANAASKGKPITLKGGYTLEDYIADRDTLSLKIGAIRSDRLSRTFAAATRDTRKIDIRENLTRWRGAVNNKLMDTPYAAGLPTLPLLAADEADYKAPFLAMNDRWKTIDALGDTVPDFTPPLTIGDDIPRAVYEAELLALEESFRALGSIDSALDTGRGERDDLLPGIKKRATQYKGAIVDRFGTEHPLYKSLPALSPTPGATPAAVALTGVWDATRGVAVLIWTPASAADLDRYEVRTTGSLPYRTDDEEMVGSTDARTLRLETVEGLIVPGDVASFKVYVVTKTRHERGSNAVKITRV